MWFARTTLLEPVLEHGCRMAWHYWTHTVLGIFQRMNTLCLLQARMSSALLLRLTLQQTFRHVLYDGSTPLVYSAFLYTSYSGSMTTSRTIIKYFNSGDSIYSLFSTTSYIEADGAYPTALYGFLYSSYVPVSWCVQANTGGYLTGEVNPVGFNKIIENEGSGWSASTNKFSVPRAGVYYIHLSAGLYLTTKLELMLNSAIVANLHHSPSIGFLLHYRE
jgi:hypothetical protein